MRRAAISWLRNYQYSIVGWLLVKTDPCSVSRFYVYTVAFRLRLCHHLIDLLGGNSKEPLI